MHTRAACSSPIDVRVRRQLSARDKRTQRTVRVCPISLAAGGHAGAAGASSRVLCELSQRVPSTLTKYGSEPELLAQTYAMCLWFPGPYLGSLIGWGEAKLSRRACAKKTAPVMLATLEREKNKSHDEPTLL
jgi:hypothetical protein